MAVPGTFFTSVFPFRSRIWPRGASMRTERTWLFIAAWRYCGPESTCSAQSRKKSTPKAASATAPRIPIRSASCGVKRYGPSTRGSGGRKRSGPVGRLPLLLAKEPDLRRALRSRREREQPPRDRVHGEGEKQVQRDLRRERFEQHAPGRDRVAEQVVQEQRPDLYEDGRHGDRDEGRMAAVTAGRLAVAADPVAGDRQEQRGDAERAQGGRVDEQPGREAGGGAIDRPAKERDRDQGEEDDVGIATQDRDVREDRHLQDRSDEDEHGGLERLEQVDRHRLRSFSTSTITDWSESKCTRGETCACQKRSTSLWLAPLT